MKNFIIAAFIFIVGGIAYYYTHGSGILPKIILLFVFISCTFFMVESFKLDFINRHHYNFLLLKFILISLFIAYLIRLEQNFDSGLFLYVNYHWVIWITGLFYCIFADYPHRRLIKKKDDLQKRMLKLEFKLYKIEKAISLSKYSDYVNREDD